MQVSGVICHAVMRIDISSDKINTDTIQSLMLPEIPGLEYFKAQHLKPNE